MELVLAELDDGAADDSASFAADWHDPVAAAQAKRGTLPIFPVSVKG
jgi:hypothetical protein